MRHLPFLLLAACADPAGKPTDPTTTRTPSTSTTPPPVDTDDTDTVPVTTPSTPLEPDPCIAAGTCPFGEWFQVTPADLAPLDFGPGPVVVDPGHPSDLYMGGGGDGIWKSGDYGNTWTRINDTIGYVPMGLVIAVAGTEPATVWVSGYKLVHRSIDGGYTYEELPNDLELELYSFELDPYDDDHLISGIHEGDGIAESTDGGETWTMVGGAGFPSGGVSWYPSFVDTGDPATTRTTWFAIAQNGASATITRDAGATWNIPAGIEGLNHGHGNAQVFQQGDTLFVPGVGGPGDGVYRSTDGGDSFTRVNDGVASVAWGTATDVYAMWGWACSSCDLGAGFRTASLPGDVWTSPEVPPELVIGANHVAVTGDGEHDVFVGTMWASGVWKYVTP